ncbi:MAG: cytochrome c biogenesis protein CcdA [Bacteroidia bacterium]
MRYFLRFSLLLAGILSFLNTANAQIFDPVKWNYSTKKISNCEYQLIFKAKIDGNWHMYGQKAYDDGPVSTSFHFTESPDYSLVGKTKEGKLIKKLDSQFGVELEFFEHEAVFTQNIKVKTPKAIEVKGNVEFMVCNDRQCLPPKTLDFSFTADATACAGTAVVPTNTNTTSAIVPTSSGNCDCNEIYRLLSELNTKNKAETAVAKDTAKAATPAIITEEPKKEPEQRSWWAIFIAGFLGGLAALLTPCVFPMLPMTVSFFTKSSKTKAKGISNAIIYGISIIAIYVLLGLGITIAFGPDALNAMSTNVWFNLAFFLLLVVFAISFLGAFEIVLPSRFINKMDAQSDRGGLIGIFFMAFTLSLVSFSCTGPIIGTLLVEAAVNGGLQGPFWGMFGFAIALALPFGLFAAFPGWMNTLPKSGGWLNSVKVVLGFLELALALKFASNADLVVQAGIITREIFIAIWIVIFGLLGIYLMGWIRLPHDSPLSHLSVSRLFLAIVTFSFTVYLIPGLWGAPLKLISGFTPPDFYSEAPNGFGAAEKLGSKDGPSAEHCPNRLPCFHDYNEALEYAKKVEKPLLIDFTGLACINCRKMEAQVWSDPEVDKRLRNEIVLVSLYVDDKKELPLNEQTIKKLGDRDFTIKTIGNKWSYMQADRYKTNAQPQYVLVDHNEQMLTKETAHYDPDIPKYIRWLDEGINEFKKRAGK